MKHTDFNHGSTLGILALLFLLPVAVLILVSLAPGWRFPDVWPAAFSLRGVDFFIRHHEKILLALASSFGFSLLTVAVTLMMCLVPAAVFARNRFPGKALMEGLLLTPALVPPMTFAMGLHFIFIKISLADTTAGVVLILAMFSYPYMFRALVAGFQTMGEDYRTCARNLGATPADILFRVEFPLLVPSIIAGGSVPSFTGTLFPLLSSSNRSLAAILTLIFLFLPVLLFVVMDVSLMRMYRKKGMVSV